MWLGKIFAISMCTRKCPTWGNRTNVLRLRRWTWWEIRNLLCIRSMADTYASGKSPYHVYRARNEENEVKRKISCVCVQCNIVYHTIPMICCARPPRIPAIRETLGPWEPIRPKSCMWKLRRCWTDSPSSHTFSMFSFLPSLRRRITHQRTIRAAYIYFSSVKLVFFSSRAWWNVFRYFLLHSLALMLAGILAMSCAILVYRSVPDVSLRNQLHFDYRQFSCPQYRI